MCYTTLFHEKKNRPALQAAKSAHYYKKQAGKIRTNKEETCWITTNKNIPAYADSKANTLRIVAEK